ncbi:MAG: hypothetical protein H6862_03130 [Rhodospirillales bacterium]|nr:hypothetical protein [Rhodospirillales bacterium]
MGKSAKKGQKYGISFFPLDVLSAIMTGLIGFAAAISQYHGRKSLSQTTAADGGCLRPANMVPEGILPLKSQIRLPKLAGSEVALMRRENLSEAGKVLASHIIKSLEQTSAQ